MNLHGNLVAFRKIVYIISKRTGIAFQILEKDYYVMLMLKELSTKQSDIHAYFKGGTALYKILGKGMRFSEDIDLTVEVCDCTNTQGKKRLEKASNGYTSLSRIQNHEGGRLTRREA